MTKRQPSKSFGAPAPTHGTLLAIDPNLTPVFTDDERALLVIAVERALHIAEAQQAEGVLNAAQPWRALLIKLKGE